LLPKTKHELLHVLGLPSLPEICAFAMSGKTPYTEISRSAIAGVEAAFGAPGKQGNAGNTSRTIPGAADIDTPPAPGVEGYRKQSPEADATFYGRQQAGQKKQ